MDIRGFWIEINVASEVHSILSLVFFFFLWDLYAEVDALISRLNVRGDICSIFVMVWTCGPFFWLILHCRLVILLD